MKRLSYILLAAMLVAALAVSCTAEVIDDMGLVSVDFEGVRDNGSKGLTVAQAALDVYDSNISWTYKAYKDVGDNTPATGTQTEDNVQLPGGISSGKLTLSLGVWNFELFGYVNGVLVYQGKAMDQSINGKNATVQIKVSPQKNGENGTLVFAEGIVVTDGLGNSFNANKAYVKGIDVEYSGSVNLSSASSLVLKSGSYNVGICCEGDGFTYAEANAVVTIYDGLESVISGTLDENTAEAGFGVIKVDAAAGTTSQSQAVDSAKTKYEFGFSPVNSDDAKTVVEVVDGSFVPDAGAENNTVDLVVYNKDAAEKKFVISDGSGMVFAGLDLSLNGASFAENTKVKVSTYIKAGLPGTPKVVYNGNPSEIFVVTYNPTTGLLEFETKHFSEYYVVFEGLVAYNETLGNYYTSLEDAFKAVSEGSSLLLLEDVKLESILRIPTSFIFNLNSKTLSLSKKACLVYGQNSEYENVAVSEKIVNGSIVCLDGGYIRFEDGSKCEFVNLNIGVDSSLSNKWTKFLQVYANNKDVASSIINVYSFYGCAFDDVYMSFEGCSGTKNEYQITVENCSFTAEDMGNGAGCILIDDYDVGSLSIINSSFDIKNTKNGGHCVYVDTYLDYTNGEKFDVSLNDVVMETQGNAQPYSYRFLNYNSECVDNANVILSGTNVFKHNDKVVEIAVKDVSSTNKSIVWVENKDAFLACYSEWISYVKAECDGFSSSKYYLVESNGYYFVGGQGQQFNTNVTIVESEGIVTEVIIPGYYTMTYKTIGMNDVSTELGERDNLNVHIYELSW